MNNLKGELKLEEHRIVKEKPLFNEKALLFILAAFQFTHVLDFVIMMPLGPQFVKVFNISSQEFGFLVAAYTWSAGIFSLIGAFFIDKFDRRKALLVLFAGFSIGTFFCSISPTYLILLISRIFAGAFGGILGALVMTTIGDAIPFDRRGKATGLVMSSFSIASVVGIPLGVYLADHFDWHTPFFFLAALSFAVWIYAYKYLPSLTGHINSGKAFRYLDFLVNLMRDRNQKLALGLAIILQIAGFLIIPYFAQYVVFNVKLSNQDLTYVYLCGGIFSFFTSRLTGALADKYGNKAVFIAAAIISIIPTIACTQMPELPLWGVLVITTCFFIFNGGRFVPAMAIMTSSVETNNRGGFMSITSSFQQVASGIASFVAGYIVVQNAETKRLSNFDYVGYLSIAAVMLCVVMVSFIKKPNKF